MSRRRLAIGAVVVAVAATVAAITLRDTRREKTTHPPLPKPPFDLNTYEGVVADIVANLSPESKTRLREMEKSELSRLHLGWGMSIRNHYKFWWNEALVISCAKQRGLDGYIHPDDASMIAMEGVCAVVNSQD